MKRILSAFALLSLLAFASCSKELLSSPSAASIQTSSTPVSFSSSNIAINGFQAQKSNNQITIDFTTTFQKGVKTLEILRGTTPSNLCSIYKTNVSEDSYSSLQYSTEDTLAAPTQYYMVKYTLQNSDWGYTPVYTLQK